MAARTYGTCTKQAGPFMRNPAHVAANDTFVPYEINLAALKDLNGVAIDVIGGAVEADGRDIVITDINGVAYPRIIPTFNKTTPVGLLIVQLPAINTVTGSAEYYLQWGGAAVANSALVFQDCYGGAADFNLVWTCNESSGNVIDWSGNGYTGTLSAGSYSQLAKVGTGIGLTSGYIYNADAHNFERTQPMSFLCWIDETSVPAEGCLYLRITTPATGVRLEMVSGKPYYCLYGDGTHFAARFANTAISTALIQLSTTYDGSSAPAGMTIYENGAVKPSSEASNTLDRSILSSNPLYIGMDSGTYYPMKAILNYIRIVKTTLSTNQIATAYNNENGYATNTGVVMTGAYLRDNPTGTLPGSIIVGIGVGVGF